MVAKYNPYIILMPQSHINGARTILWGGVSWGKLQSRGHICCHSRAASFQIWLAVVAQWQCRARHGPDTNHGTDMAPIPCRGGTVAAQKVVQSCM